MKQQWTLHDIDEMDIHFFFELTRYAHEREQTPNLYIDQIPGF